MEVKGQGACPACMGEDSKLPLLVGVSRVMGATGEVFRVVTF